jgi:uncharacterized membrane protein
VLESIEAPINAAEARTSGEVRFVVETALEPAEVWAALTPRERRLQTFSDLHIWNTELRNGVLIYVLLADRDVEIVADAARRPHRPGRLGRGLPVMEGHFRAAASPRARWPGRAVGALLERTFRHRGPIVMSSEPAQLL